MHLRTARLELDAADHGVWTDLLAGVMGPAAPGYPTVGDLLIARLVADGHLPSGEWGPWQVRALDSGALIGGVGFTGAPGEDGVVEINYGLASQARGHGFATEAVMALVAHAGARGAHCVVAETDCANVASQAVVLRAGFAETHRDESVVRWEIVLDVPAD